MEAAHLADHAKAAGLEAVLDGGGRAANGSVQGRAALAPRALLLHRRQHRVQRGRARRAAVALLALSAAGRLARVRAPLAGALAIGLLA